MLGGVEIIKGIPNEADIATKMAVDGAGMKAVASGINRITVAVLLIRAESVALMRHSKNKISTG